MFFEIHYSEMSLNSKNSNTTESYIIRICKILSNEALI
jgi:hypothetical protein